jgi:hypothetical protein
LAALLALLATLPGLLLLLTRLRVAALLLAGLRIVLILLRILIRILIGHVLLHGVLPASDNALPAFSFHTQTRLASGLMFRELAVEDTNGTGPKVPARQSSL